MSGRRRKEVPLVFGQPVCAYVKRLEPKWWQGKKLPEKLPRVDDIRNICRDLEGEVARGNGGGHYRARLYDQATKKLFHGVHEFEVAFEPKIDGEPIPPRTPKAKPAGPVATRRQAEPDSVGAERRRRRTEASRRGRKRQGARRRLDNAVRELRELLGRDRQQEAREAEDRRKAREKGLKALREEERRAVEQLRHAFGSGPELSPSPGAPQDGDRDVAAGSVPPLSSSDEDAESDPEEPWQAATGPARPDPNDGDGGDDDDPEELDADTEPSTGLLTAFARAPQVEPTASPSGRALVAESGHRPETCQDPMRALTNQLLDSATRSRARRRSLSRLKTGLGRVADAAEALLVRRGASDPSPQEESPPESTT